jgi:hypothetical protein
MGIIKINNVISGGQTTALSGARSKISKTFSPTSLANLALWLDAGDRDTLKQNSNGTGAVTAVNDPIGYWGDKSGTGKHFIQETSGSRPFYALEAGQYVVKMTGTQFMTKAAPVFSANSPLTFFIAYKNNGGTWATIYSAGGTGGFLLRNYLSTGQFEVVANNATVTRSTSSFIGASNVIDITVPTSGTTLANFAGAQLPVLVSTTATPAGLNNTTHYLGRRSDTYNALADIYEIVVYERVLTDAEKQQVRDYLSAKWRFQLAPRVTNTEAQNWINRAYANGSTVSLQTATAVSTFCSAIEAASLRTKFYRLNLMCGDSLNAALVPLYRGQSLAGTQYGSEIDAATNFPTTNYQSSGVAGGLLGVLNSAYINTGLPQNTAATNDRHLAVYEAPPLPTNAYATLISSVTSGVTTDWFIAYGSPPTTVRYSGLGASGSYVTDPVNNTSEAFWIGSNNATQSALYKNGAVAASATNNLSPQVTNASNIIVYAVNASASAQNPNSCLRAYSVGTNFTAAEAATYSTIMQTFQRALGRSFDSRLDLHADAQSWYQRVVANGGAADENTLRAVSNFCGEIDATDLRDKIYRLNLCAGDNINAAVVPLYAGPVNGWATKNILGLNENFARWLLVNGTITQNAIAAPNGTMTADLFVENSTAANNYGVRQNVDLAASTTYTLSCYIKKKDLRYVQLNLYVGQNTGAYFDLDTGAVANTFGPATSPTITAAGNGWWRCSITATNTTATNDRPMYILPTTQSNDSGHVGVVGAGTYFWGAQLEVGSLTAYAPHAHGGLLDVNTGYTTADYTLNGGFNANTTSGTKHLVLSDKPIKNVLSDLTNVHMATTIAASATWTGNRRTLSTFQNVNGTGGSYGFSVAASGQVTGTVSSGVSFTTMAFDNVFRNYVISRTSNTSVRGYVNGVYGSQSLTNTTTYLNTKTRLASGTSFYDTTDGTGVESSPYESWPGRIADYSVGLGLDDTQAAALATAFQNFRTAIGRV